MKILMLHGYTQNAHTFQIKCKALTTRICKSYPDAEFVWPDGPFQLDPNDIPTVHDGQDTEALNLRAWFDLRFTSHPPNGLLASLDLIANVLRTQGPFDGVIAFSQGTVIAAFVASLLQGHARHSAWARASQAGLDVFGYPASFQNLYHPQFDFGVLVAGRVGAEEYYDWLYKSPRVATPFCHVMGALDSMVEHEERDIALKKISGGQALVKVEHGGGHFVPKEAASLDRIVRFIRDKA